MVHVFLEGISTILLVGASMLLLLWKKEVKNAGDKLIKNVGLSMALVSLYKAASVINILFSLGEWMMVIMKVPELIGVVFLMLSLFKYLEARK
ncbi:MAG TPA: hypothetical protein VI790_04250 [Candidatus Nanoarchaeia archaeon]|nr:hypothetical protein [Candidatus Nanoarchaeia archaeon]